MAAIAVVGKHKPLVCVLKLNEMPIYMEKQKLYIAINYYTNCNPIWRVYAVPTIKTKAHPG
jgi:hypothetical protein